jgi:4'-phosphopantetheinyl transferase
MIRTTTLTPTPSTPIRHAREGVERGRLSHAPRHVDLWVVFTREVSDDALREYRDLLSPDERRRGDRFYFADDRRTHAIARALVRTTLSRYVNIRPDEWRFSSTQNGRPVIAADQIADAPLAFNLSHTSQMVALAVRRKLAVGVDVEHVRSRIVSLDMADRFFSLEEAYALRSVPPARRQDRFFEYWTLKESYIKARGAGLAIPLDQFSFSLPSPSRVSVSISPALEDTPARWRLWQLWPSPEHVLALCAERTREREELTVRRCVPLRFEEMLRLPVHRDSDDRDAAG